MEELNKALADLGLSLDADNATGDDGLDEEAAAKKEKKKKRAERLKQQINDLHANGGTEEPGKEEPASIQPAPEPEESEETPQLIDPAQASTALWPTRQMRHRAQPSSDACE